MEASDYEVVFALSQGCNQLEFCEVNNNGGHNSYQIRPGQNDNLTLLSRSFWLKYLHQFLTFTLNQEALQVIIFISLTWASSDAQKCPISPIHLWVERITGMTIFKQPEAELRSMSQAVTFIYLLLISRSSVLMLSLSE